MILDTVDEKKKGVHTRYLILLIIFIVTAVNYADRATLSIAGTEVAKELQLSAVSMGYIFSAFGWAYLLMQIPGGWLLDKFGSKKVYTYSLFFWSPSSTSQSNPAKPRTSVLIGLESADQQPICTCFAASAALNLFGKTSLFIAYTFAYFCNSIRLMSPTTKR